MSQDKHNVGSTDQTTPGSQSVLGGVKNRSWLRIAIVVVVVLALVAAFRMWYESRELDKLSNRSTGVSGQP